MDSSIDFLLLYQKLIDILPSGNLQGLMEACHEIVGVPILVVDIMYNLLGIAPREKTGDYAWDYLLEHRGYDGEMISTLYKEGIMQSPYEHTPPYIVDWGTYNVDYPKIQGVIKVNDIIEGYVTMQCAREQITPDRMKAMEIIMSVCALFFKNTSIEDSAFSNYQKTFVRELFNSRILTKRQMSLWLHDFDIQLNPPYRVVAIGAANSREVNVLSYLHKSMHQYFLYQMSIILDDVLYILQYNLNLMPVGEDARRQLDNILIKFNAHCGFSNTFSDLLEVPGYKIQAEDALRLGRDLRKSLRIYDYSDYYLSAILAPRAAHMPQSNYISPVIPLLQDHDKTHSTDFLNTLHCYVKNLGNMAETAKDLYIHRNTLMYRIGRIEKISGVSLKDYDVFMHLMISFYMQDLQKNMSIYKGVTAARA